MNARRASRIERKRAAERFGRFAEFLAATALRLRGYRIVHRRFRSPQGEIDIVALRGTVLAIVEVKARAERDSAAWSLSRGQRLRIERAAQALVARDPALAAFAVRFDLVLVGRWRWPEHVEDAWRPGMA